MSFRRVTRRQSVQINTYISEINHVIQNTRYGEKQLFVENTTDDNTISVVSEGTNITIHPKSEYNFNRSMDLVLYVRETPAFSHLEAGERAVYNSNWTELQERISRNNTLVDTLNNEIILYKKYIEKTLSDLEKRLQLINEIFNNMKLLLPGYGDEQIGNDKLVNILEKQFSLYEQRHKEFIEYLKTNKNSQCYTALSNTLEISVTPLNNLITEVNDLNNSCTSGLIGNVVYSIDNLESTLDMYRKTNAETVENIHNNRKIVKETRERITSLLKNYTNGDLSATIIVDNLDKLASWKAALESDLNNSTALHSKNSTIQNIINLFTNIRIKTSVSDEILIEHLRRNTREKILMR